jgi:hypothetical protein
MLESIFQTIFFLHKVLTLGDLMIGYGGYSYLALCFSKEMVSMDLLGYRKGWFS